MKTDMVNHLYLGDNLDVMKDIPDGCIDLIATDPPYFTQRNWDQYTDRWKTRDEYLDFMRLRLMQLRRVLKKSGSIYLQCDWHVVHHIKLLMDDVFGEDCFRNDIVWCYAPHGNSPKIGFQRRHDNILFYAGANATFNHQYTPLTKDAIKRYNGRDEIGRYKIHSGRKNYLETHKGRPVISWWDDIPSFSTSTGSPERTAYSTQKPLALYRRIVNASSNEGDVVLDPFMGSGTTMEAARSLGRKYIGIDRNPLAIAIAEKRLDQYGNLDGFHDEGTTTSNCI